MGDFPGRLVCVAIMMITAEWGHIDGTQPDALRPKVGTVWVWELSKEHARCLVEVTRVRWNGEEWWVECQPIGTAGAAGWAPTTMTAVRFPRDRSWNDLSRFMEAALPVVGTIEALATVTERGAVPDPVED